VPAGAYRITQRFIHPTTYSLQQLCESPEHITTVPQIREAERQLKKPFESVRAGEPAQTTDLKRRLSAMRRFVPWGGGGNFVPRHMQTVITDENEDNTEEDGMEKGTAPEQLPEGVEPLFLWQPGAYDHRTAMPCTSPFSERCPW
jgi:hypothetical protein